MRFPSCETCQNNSVNINLKFITIISENKTKMKKKFGPPIQVTAIKTTVTFLASIVDLNHIRLQMIVLITYFV